MDPKALDASDWQQVVAAANQFWFFAVCVVLAALSFGLAHAVMPSLRATGQLSPSKAAVRPLLYFISAISLALAAFMLYRGLGLAIGVIRDIYPRFWF